MDFINYHGFVSKSYHPTIQDKQLGLVKTLLKLNAFLIIKVCNAKPLWSKDGENMISFNLIWAWPNCQLNLPSAIERVA